MYIIKGSRLCATGTDRTRKIRAVCSRLAAVCSRSVLLLDRVYQPEVGRERLCFRCFFHVRACSRVFVSECFVYSFLAITRANQSVSHTYRALTSRHTGRTRSPSDGLYL